jgi:acyl carrier protein
MGLDAVEIVLRTEDEFSITLGDEEVAATRTVREFYQLVLSKLDTTPACASSQAFYRTRRAIVECLGITRRSVRPTTHFESILPAERRPSIWKQIGDAAKLTLPRLQYTATWKSRFIWIGICVATAIVALSFAAVTWLGIGFAFSFGVGAVLWILILGITDTALLQKADFLRTELPCATVGDLSLMVLTLNQSEFDVAAEKRQKMTHEDVWLRVVHIIADQQGLEPDEILPDARFVEDLGVS